jgi:hypothetical protein
VLALKGISLWQPHASLVAVGFKLIETRGWDAFGYVEAGERIAIQAAMNRSWLNLISEPPFETCLRKAEQAGTLALVDGKLPLGYIIATATLVDSVEITDKFIADLANANPLEFMLGDYRPGRFAWSLDDVKPLATPIRFRGRQKFFDVPDELLPAA